LNWKNQFEEEKKNLEEIFKDIAITIEHIGSTSIEELSAKPIIDIAIGVSKLENFEKVRNKIITNKNYSIREENPEGEILVRKGTDDYTSYLIHVMEYESDRYKNTIIFRDYLRKNKEDKIKYENLKKELGIKYKDNREMYTASKNDFIQGILKKAKS